MGTSSFCGLEGGESIFENLQPVQPKAAGEKEPEEKMCEYKMMPDQRWQETTQKSPHGSIQEQKSHELFNGIAPLWGLRVSADLPMHLRTLES